MVTSPLCATIDQQYPEINASSDKCTNSTWESFYWDKSEDFSNYLLSKNFGQKPLHRILQIIFLQNRKCHHIVYQYN